MPDVLGQFDLSPAGILDYVDRFGSLPFAISGGSGEDDDGDGDDEDEDTEDAGGEGDQGGKGTGKDGDGDTEGLRTALQKARTEKKTADRELKKALKRIDALENAGKPETEQLKNKADTAERERDDALTKLQDKAGRVGILEAAVKAGSPKPDLVYRLVKDDIDFNDEFEVTNAKELIRQAKEDAPELFKASKGKGNGGNQDEGGRSNSGGGMNAFIRRAAGIEQ